jgi:hypothetical protein
MFSDPNADNSPLSVPVSVTTSVYAQTVLADNPLRYYHLGEKPLYAADSSGNGNSAGIIGGVTAGQPGPTGDGTHAFAFDGGGGTYVGAVPQTPTTLSGTFTVVAVVKASSITSGYQTIFGSRSPSDGSFDIQVNTAGVHGDIGTGSSWMSNSANASWPAGSPTWWHIAYVVTPSAWTIFINGSQQATGGLSGGTPLLWNASHHLFMGWNGCGCGDLHFSGTLAEIAVFSSALTAANLSTLYSALSGTSYASTVAGLSPTGYWRLGDSGSAIRTLADSSTSALNATVSGGGYVPVAGALVGDTDTALAFDGRTGYAVIPAGSGSTALPSGNSTWSVEAWFKTSAAFNFNFLAFLGASSSKTTVQLYLDSGGHVCLDSWGTAICTPQGSYNGNTWHHAVGTYDGTTAKLYVDGVLTASSTALGPENISYGNAAIGAQYNGGYANLFNGALDEVAIYGSALSASQVAAHYHVGSTGGP